MSQSQSSPIRPVPQSSRTWNWRTGLYGFVALSAALALDQAHKYWMIEIYRIGERGRVTLTPFFDVLLTWNRGISYGLLQQNSTGGRVFLIGFALAAVAALTVWMLQVGTRLGAVSLGLIIGGALGNIVDRVIHGAVADFFLLHYGEHNWYIFNIADAAIVAGVAGILLDWLRPRNR